MRIRACLKLPFLLGTFLLSSGPVLGQTKVAVSAEEICPLLPGVRIPSVTLERLDGTAFKLLEEVSRQRSILIFYRGGW